jgi:hypothetical protein
MMIIHRPKLTEKFVMLPNDMVHDDRLSCLARCILAELVARPPKWQTTADKMAEAAKKARGARAESRRAFRMAFAELEELGYIVRKRTRIPKGQPGGGDFITILRVYAVPQTGHHEPLTDEGFMDEPLTHEWFMDEGSLVSTDEEDGSGKGPGQDSASLAGARASEQAQTDSSTRLDRLYDQARRLTDEQLRRLLLGVENNRPRKYRDFRRSAMQQLNKMDPWKVKGEHGVRDVDELSFLYALQHYAKSEQGLPAFLTTFPKPRQKQAAEAPW